jgi:lysophospholipase L1-like esterase
MELRCRPLSLRLDELVELNPDYVLIQFGHNDQKRYDPIGLQRSPEILCGADKEIRREGGNC